MIYKDIFIFTTDGASSTVQFEESIDVCEIFLNGTATLATVKIYHSVGNRNFRQIGTITVNTANPGADVHVTAWPPGFYYATVSGLTTGTLYVSFSGE